MEPVLENSGKEKGEENIHLLRSPKVIGMRSYHDTFIWLDLQEIEGFSIYSWIRLSRAVLAG